MAEGRRPRLDDYSLHKVSPASAAPDLDDMDERVRVASFTLLWPHPHTLMVEDAALFSELSQNTKNGAEP